MPSPGVQSTISLYVRERLQHGDGHITIRRRLLDSKKDLLVRIRWSLQQICCEMLVAPRLGCLLISARITTQDKRKSFRRSPKLGKNDTSIRAEDLENEYQILGTTKVCPLEDHGRYLLGRSLRVTIQERSIQLS